MEEGLNRGKWARDLGLSPQEKEKLQAAPLLTLKSCLFVSNLNEEEFRHGPRYPALRKLAAARGLPLVPILGDLEVELQDLSPEERSESLPGLGLEEPGIHRLVREFHRPLGLVTFYTIAGPPGGPPAL